MATTYYTYTPSTRTLAPAPKAVRTAQGIVCNPTQATLRCAGIAAYPKEIDPPMPPAEEGKIVVPNGYALVDGAWVKQWRYEDAPPKEYNVYKLILALKSLDVTLEGQTMKAIVPAVEWIKSQGLYEEFVTIRTIRADDTDLMAAISTLASVLGVTDAQVAEIMESVEVG